jgi:(hydroxyamino)benzene mutase
MNTPGRKLMWRGAFLFLLGLLTGMLETHFTNIHMALSAHLEGVMNGTFLIAVGAIWNEVRLPPIAKATTYWVALWGTYVNWLTTTLAAIWGTAVANPIAATGHQGLPWQEQLAGAGFLSVSIAITAASVLLVWGLRPDYRRSSRDIDVVGR